MSAAAAFFPELVCAGDLEIVRRSRLIGQLPGRNKLKTGSRLPVSKIPRNQIHSVLLRGAVKLAGIGAADCPQIHSPTSASRQAASAVADWPR